VNCFSPRWSPDGALIAYWSNYPPLGGAVAADSGVTIVADTTGANPREIVATRQRTSGYPGQPAAWSPDGRRFAYTYGDGRLFITGLDGSPAVLIALDELVSHAAWSPDGSRIAVHVPGGGIGLVQLTNPPPTGPASLVRFDTENDDFHPAWSPDGRQIVFATFVSVAGENVYHLAVINSDGTDRVDLTPGRQALAYLPRWNPASPR
jgi:Tol biopolymer transport system component